MNGPNIGEVVTIDRRGCCYNSSGEHEGSFEPMPLSNDDIAGYFLEYIAEKLPAIVDQDKAGTTYTQNVILFRDIAGRLQNVALQLTEISNSSSEHFELRTEITGLIYC